MEEISKKLRRGGASGQLVFWDSEETQPDRLVPPARPGWGLSSGGKKYLFLEVEVEAWVSTYPLSSISIIKGTVWGTKSLPEAVTEGIFKTLKEDV